MSTSHPVIPPTIAFREYDGLVVALDTRTGCFRVLTGPARDLWRKVLAGAPLTAAETGLAGRLAGMGLLASAGELPSPAGPAPFLADMEPCGRGILEDFASQNLLPLTGHLELTQRCNLRCRHCFIRHGQAVADLSTDEACRLIADLAAGGVFALALTGGEIFTRPDMPVILDCLSRHRFAVRINTNATLLDDQAIRMLADCPAIYRVHVSLYAAEAAVHDAITAVPGSFVRTRRALSALAEAGVKVRINTVIMNSNWEHWQAVKTTVADRLGIPIRFDPEVMPMDDGGIDNLAERIDEERMAEVRRLLSRETTGSDSRPGMATQKNCRAALSFFAITARGDLYPCMGMRRVSRSPIGNVFEESFQSLWRNSPRLAELRGAIAGMCHVCGEE